MREVACDVLIVGGGTGGCAAAMATTAMGYRTILTEETDWIGGQLTSQAVPPDEHPWIEQFGCTARYRAFREGVRRFYRDHTPLLPAYRNDPGLNPGSGWVSRLCHEPRIGWQVLNQMLHGALCQGLLEIRLNTALAGSSVLSQPRLTAQIPAPKTEHEEDRVDVVHLIDLISGAETLVSAKFVLDATEMGDLLPLTDTEYVVGAESKDDTAEPNAVDGEPQPGNVQGFTWCMAIALDEGSHRVIDKPAMYDVWRAYKPDFWPGPHLGFDILNPHTGAVARFPFMADGWYSLMRYRQIVEPTRFAEGHHPHPATVMNWPQNDYFTQTITDVPQSDVVTRLEESRQLSLSVLYWLQTEAPRHDGGVGYPGVYGRPDLTGAQDGFAKMPYIRESRRIVARKIVREQDLAAYANPGCDRAPSMADSVGIGSYRIDLHPSTSGANTIDTSSLPFQIPLGSLVPVRMKNLIPACKNLGVTHITNGCYRLHPVEWNIGESAGLLAAFCLRHNTEPGAVLETSSLLADFQSLLRNQGVELEWPTLRAL